MVLPVIHADGEYRRVPLDRLSCTLERIRLEALDIELDERRPRTFDERVERLGADGNRAGRRADARGAGGGAGRVEMKRASLRPQRDLAAVDLGACRRVAQRPSPASLAKFAGSGSSARRWPKRSPYMVDNIRTVSPSYAPPSTIHSSSDQVNRSSGKYCGCATGCGRPSKSAFNRKRTCATYSAREASSSHRSNARRTSARSSSNLDGRS